MRSRAIQTGLSGVIHTVDVSPAGDTFVLGHHSEDGQTAILSLWSMDSLKLIADLDRWKNETITMARFSPDGGTIAYCGTSLNLHTVEVRSHRATTIDSGIADVQWIAFAEVGPRLVVSGATTKVLELGDGATIWALPEDAATDRPQSVAVVGALTDDGGRIAACAVEEGKITIWNVNSGDVSVQLGEAPKYARWLAFDRHNRHLLALDWYTNGTFLWDMETGQRHLPEIFNEEAEANLSARFQPGGGYLALGMLTGFVNVCRVGDGESVFLDQVHGGRVWDLAFTPDGDRMLSVAEDGSLNLWDID